MIPEGDMSGLLAQAQAMQEQLLTAQQELAEMRVEGTAGGDMVTATVTGSGELVGLAIKPEAVDPEDTETLADLILAAVRDASDRAHALASAKHVIPAAELAGALHRDDILGLFHDADDRLVPARIAADAALHVLGNVEAGLTELHRVLDQLQSCGEPEYVVRLGGQDVKSKPLRTFRPDARQPAELVDQVLDRTFVHT